MIEKFVADVSAGRTARDSGKSQGKRIIVSGGKGAAGKVVRDLSAVFSFAMRTTEMAINPCLSARKPVDGKRYRYLSLQELSILGATLDTMQRVGINQKAIWIARLLAVTGCRRNEIVALRWEEVHLEEQRLVLADSKTGRSYRALSKAAIDILTSIPRTSIYVFPAERGAGHFQGLSKFWRHLQVASGLADCTPHTLRHTFGSMAASTGDTLHMVGALLGHSNERSSAIYAHMQMDPVLQSADRLGSLVALALRGGGNGEI